MFYNESNGYGRGSFPNTMPLTGNTWGQTPFWFNQTPFMGQQVPFGYLNQMPFTPFNQIPMNYFGQIPFNNSFPYTNQFMGQNGMTPNNFSQCFMPFPTTGYWNTPTGFHNPTCR